MYLQFTLNYLTQKEKEEEGEDLFNLCVLLTLDLCAYCLVPQMIIIAKSTVFPLQNYLFLF